jgi:AcrR family transcriptional regulator
MKRTKEEAEQTRRDILAAALSTFSSQGYERTRLEDVGEAASVTRGAIYHHFGSKAGLFLALVEDASARGNQAIEAAIQEGGSVTEITRRILIYSMNLLEEDPRFREVMALTLSLQVSSPDLTPLVQRRYEEAELLVDNISRFLQMGQDQGEFDPDVDPATAARAMLAYQNGLAMLWISNPEAFSVRESAPALADLFVRGLQKA